MPSRRERKPRLCILSYQRLSHLVRTIIPEYSHRAEIDMTEVVFQDALDLGREIESKRQYDVIISAGANAELLRDTLNFPVVSIKVTGYDLLVALTKAGEISDHVGVGIYQEKIERLESVKHLLQVKITQQTYQTVADARECVWRLRNDGLKVIVGSSLVVELAEACDLVGILVYSPESIRQAIEDALQIAELSVREDARYDSLNSVVRHLREAVLAVDAQHRITAINPSMEQLIGLPRPALLGRNLGEVAPDLSLERVLGEREPDVGTVLTYGGKSYLVSRTPLRELGSITGAVLVMYDTQTIQRADVVVRSQRKSKGFAARYSFDQIIGVSPTLQQACSVAKRCAHSTSTVLITGESGTGKELFAQAIHSASPRGGGPFVALNCASFPETLLESELFGYEDGAFTGSRKGGKPGLFETAHTGTVFLDEIGDMPVSLQTRLLRILQEREVVRLGGVQPIPVDVRVIAATHCDLTEWIQKGRFRADLYYRLNILRVALPPLRSRREDIGVLAQKLLQGSLRRQGCALQAEQVLAPLLSTLHEYYWPGNVRELENVMERFAAYLGAAESLAGIDYDGFILEAPELHSAHAGMPCAEAGHAHALPMTDKLPVADNLSVAQALSRTKGNRRMAAEMLGISRTTLWRKMREG
ncbi:MAG: propionate catabolism operon regulatory protein PrpR [Rhodocyclaceae bacterium]|nr:propionate catabolism operon regulatory protein PrpR [Rhodocyclaceae bacterium]MBK9311299.1 propionate catabolism operon regulatory protein PrpR [Rhodocyclaceae bacterium]MBK9953761.1 propionate catabolism operon regulatory protein PrpR [Rhodocyclaceae bacterium]